MANPRKIINHLGIGYRAITMLVDGSTIAAYSATTKDGSTSAGLAVTCVTGTEDLVKLTEDNERVLGKLLSVEPDGACTVAVEGVVELPAGDSVTLIRGGKIVGALGASSAKGYIRPATAPAGSYAQAGLVSVLNADHTVLKIADPTKAQVFLGL